MESLDYHRMPPEVRQCLPHCQRGQLLGGAPHIVLEVSGRPHEQQDTNAFLLLLLKMHVRGVTKNWY